MLLVHPTKCGWRIAAPLERHLTNGTFRIHGFPEGVLEVLRRRHCTIATFKPLSYSYLRDELILSCGQAELAWQKLTWSEDGIWNE